MDIIIKIVNIIILYVLKKKILIISTCKICVGYFSYEYFFYNYR